MKTIDIDRLADRLGETRSKRKTRAAAPVAYASQFFPCARRSLYWATYLCPVCGGSHFARSRVKFENGPRTSGCGRRIDLRIARTYKGKGAI